MFGKYNKSNRIFGIKEKKGKVKTRVYDFFFRFDEPLKKLTSF